MTGLGGNLLTSGGTKGWPHPLDRRFFTTARPPWSRTNVLASFAQREHPAHKTMRFLLDVLAPGLQELARACSRRFFCAFERLSHHRAPQRPSACNAGTRHQSDATLILGARNADNQVALARLLTAIARNRSSLLPFATVKLTFQSSVVWRGANYRTRRVITKPHAIGLATSKCVKRRFSTRVRPMRSDCTVDGRCRLEQCKGMCSNRH